MKSAPLSRLRTAASAARQSALQAGARTITSIQVCVPDTEVRKNLFTVHGLLCQNDLSSPPVQPVCSFSDATNLVHRQEHHSDQLMIKSRQYSVLLLQICCRGRRHARPRMMLG